MKNLKIFLLMFFIAVLGTLIGIHGTESSYMVITFFCTVFSSLAAVYGFRKTTRALLTLLFSTLISATVTYGIPDFLVRLWHLLIR